MLGSLLGARVSRFQDCSDFWDATDLTAVAVHVEITVQGHNADSLLLAWGRHDRLLAHRTAWGKFPEKRQKMVRGQAQMQMERDTGRHLVCISCVTLT